MKWNEITHEHHGRKVSVHANSTPTHPLEGDGPWVGTVMCATEGSIPLLQCAHNVRWFAAWYEVEFID